MDCSPPIVSAPGIRIQAASLSYGGVAVFERLNFDLPAGQWTALLGPSGIGKSSLLRLLASLPPNGGVASGSVSASDGEALVNRIAYMAQRDLLLPWLSVLDNVMIGLRLRGQRIGPADRDRALSLLDQVGLVERAKDRPAVLSGGMRQRVALARTLMEDRPVVLMDEPFSALDALTRFHLQEVAARLLVGRTVFLVTHDPAEALRLADQVLVLTGTPARLVDAGPMPEGARPRDPGAPDMAARAVALTRALSGGVSLGAVA